MPYPRLCIQVSGHCTMWEMKSMSTWEGPNCSTLAHPSLVMQFVNATLRPVGLSRDSPTGIVPKCSIDIATFSAVFDDFIGEFENLL